MELTNKDLFTLFCEYLELSATEQQYYLEELKNKRHVEFERLLKLVETEHNTTEMFNQSFKHMSESYSYQVGDKLGNYKLTKILGSGGMSRVFKAERCDGKITQTVAIKILHPLVAKYRSGSFLLREAQALANLNHPNIARVYDIKEDEHNQLYIVMEFIDGVTLDSYLKQHQLKPDEKLKLFLKVVQAVHSAHLQDIIHADIKPSNILITSSDEPKLIDFGVTQLSEKLDASEHQLISGYISALTVNYAAPEQLLGKPASRSSDLYALGGVLYFMLSGKAAFEDVGGTLEEKTAYIISNAPASLQIENTVPFASDLQAILVTCLQKEKHKRYPNTQELYQDLIAFIQVKPIKASNRIITIQKALYRYKWYVASVFIVACLTVLGIWLQVAMQQEKENQLKSNYLNVLNKPQKNTLADVLPFPDRTTTPDWRMLNTRDYLLLMVKFLDHSLERVQPKQVEHIHQELNSFIVNGNRTLTSQQYFVIDMAMAMNVSKRGYTQVDSMKLKAIKDKYQDIEIEFTKPVLYLLTSLLKNNTDMLEVIHGINIDLSSSAQLIDLTKGEEIYLKILLLELNSQTSDNDYDADFVMKKYADIIALMEREASHISFDLYVTYVTVALGNYYYFGVEDKTDEYSDKLLSILKQIDENSDAFKLGFGHLSAIKPKLARQLIKDKNINTDDIVNHPEKYDTDLLIDYSSFYRKYFDYKKAYTLSKAAYRQTLGDSDDEALAVDLGNVVKGHITHSLLIGSREDLDPQLLRIFDIQSGEKYGFWSYGLACTRMLENNWIDLALKYCDMSREFLKNNPDAAKTVVAAGLTDMLWQLMYFPESPLHSNFVQQAEEIAINLKSSHIYHRGLLQALVKYHLKFENVDAAVRHFNTLTEVTNIRAEEVGLSIKGMVDYQLLQAELLLAEGKHQLAKIIIEEQSEAVCQRIGLKGYLGKLYIALSEKVNATNCAFSST